MLQKFIDYIKELNILNEDIDIDFSDLAFAYDYNEVQELFFDEINNNYVFITGETGLRKKDMLARICKDLFLRGEEKQDMLYLDYDLPILHGENIFSLIREFYAARNSSEFVYLIINEIQELGDWFSFVQKLKAQFPKLKLLCSSSTPPYIFETIYDAQADYCKIIVLSQKNASNIKYQTQSFGVYKEFKYNQKDNVIEIKGLTKEGKKMSFHSVPETINGLPVKIIASGAFHDRSELLSIALPDCVEMIGDYAFSKCNNLKEIRLPQSLTYIGEHAFLGAKSLGAIIGGENVTHIGNSAFYKTKWLEKQKDFAIIGSALYRYNGECRSVLLPKEIGYISSYAFADSEIERIKSMRDITLGEGVFYRCKNLYEVNIGLDSIPAYCFYSCVKLKAEFFVKKVGKFALYNCQSLKMINTSHLDACALAYAKKLEAIEDVCELDDGALFACSNIKELELKHVDRIGRFALAKTSIEKVKFAGSYIGDFAFCLIPKLCYAKIHHETNIGTAILFGCESVCAMHISGKYKLRYYFGGQMPKVTKLYVYGDIVDDFCRNNPYLQELQILHTKKFGGWSFYNNSALQTVILKNVAKIGDWAFAYCDGITQIELPKEVDYIGMNAFRYCHNLSEIRLLSKSVVNFGANAFYSTNGVKKFFVISNIKDKYKNIAIWNEYLDQMIEI